jgi:hypothetical protein
MIHIGYYYLAHPYSSIDKDLEVSRLHAATKIYARLARQGVKCYSPVAATTLAAKRHKMPTSHEFWIDLNETFIVNSAGIILIKLEGWDTSPGVMHEIEYAKKVDKRIHQIHAYTQHITLNGVEIAV